VDKVIPGWTEALQLMKEGDKWEIVIPSKLAYGERGAGARIPANSALVFEVELISVN
jgi:FKBP-type peptidyl-prolyl cis-trans isomerase FklB